MLQNDTKCDTNDVTELTPQQIQAINGMLSGRSLTDIARDLDISRSTLHRWKKNPAFCAVLEEAKADMCTHLQLRLGNVADSLLDILQTSILNDDAFFQRDPEFIFNFLQTITQSSMMRTQKKEE